jgi:hypothetical protein
MVNPGTFILHDAVRPAVPDGAYELSVTQALNPPGQSVDALDKHLVVSGPRFTLPPDQPLSFYPPADAVGEFSARLPQIVLRRRTLPWERYIDAAEPTLPWIALVVLADGEGQLTTGQPIDTSSLSDPDLRDSDTRDVLTVTRRVVTQVFPTKQDLPWLCHVREVDLSDTELALGDDDGWMAVVLANRIPQPGLKYTACLVSLEGHGDDLPTQETPADSFTNLTVYTISEVAAAATAQRTNERSVDMTPGAAGLSTPAVVAQAAADSRSPEAVVEPAAPPTLVGARAPATTPATPRDAWSTLALPGAVAAGQQTGTRPGGFITGRSSVVGLSIDPVYLDPQNRVIEFTVLKHWSFTCDQGGDFESLVKALDDGMLGTLPTVAPAPTTPGTPPRPPSSRPDPVVTDTGHVEAQAISRRGDQATAWYRGPFSPRQIVRTQPDPSGLLALMHTADQGRRVGPDGREDLSLAAAFEIGRLLVVAQASVVAALLAWRQSGYASSRVQQILALPEALNAQLLTVYAQQRAVFSAGVGATVLGGLGASSAARLGPVRPLTSPGPDLVGASDLATTVATGFGLDASTVQAVLRTGPGAAGVDPSVTASTLPSKLIELGPADFAAAHAALAAHVNSLAIQAGLMPGGAA